MDSRNEAEILLIDYLNEISADESCHRRIFCCGSSRSLYCPECCRVLIPEKDLPKPIHEGKLNLPFDIDIILDPKERKTSSTGVQLAALANALELRREYLAIEKPWTRVVLYDLGQEEIPRYRDEESGVFVLFPSDDSVPISSVLPKKLVVLDIKWSKVGLTKANEMARLPKVHLGSPPMRSQFWRWHNAGIGMLSTIEAIYYAAMEVTRETWDCAQRDNLKHLLWIFALQRSVIHSRSEAEQRLLPFSEEGKSASRILRSQQNGNPPKKRIEQNVFYRNLN